ncbi:hypothetical protein ACFOW4_00990 [Micromonospora sp. GCM10011542]|uniref:hypothetical protein n=1 Tax=Micromonospora sp. GCM10011542 TaxID=3317337 RepID=UPI00360B474B
MPPVALTCPLWWVARWATRLLTSLAVLAALALGAGASAAAPAQAGPPHISAGATGPPSSGWVVPCGAADQAAMIAVGQSTPIAVSHATPVAVDHATPVAVSQATPVAVSHAGSPTSPDAHAAAPAVEAAGLAEGAAGIAARWLPRTADPATRASRAPPAR